MRIKNNGVEKLVTPAVGGGERADGKSDGERERYRALSAKGEALAQVIGEWLAERGARGAGNRHASKTTDQPMDG